MHPTSSLWLDRALSSLAFAALLALAWPGVEVRAEGDLAPSARELTSLSSRPPTLAPPLANGATCAADAPLVSPQRAAKQRTAMQRLAQEMKSDGMQPMNGRGLSYATEDDPTLELARLQLEARAANPRE